MHKPDLHTVMSYRSCFSTNSGRIVLGDLLIHGGYFDTDLKTPEEIAVQNFVKRIFRNLGVCTKPESVSQYVNKILEMPQETENGDKANQEDS